MKTTEIIGRRLWREKVKELYPASVFEDKGDVVTEYTTLALSGTQVVGGYDWDSTRGSIVLPESITTSTQAGTV